MKIINKNVYKIMFGLEFLNAGEVKEFEDKKVIDMLLSQPNVEEYVAIEDAKNLEEENRKLKEELAKATTKTTTTKKSTTTKSTTKKGK